MSNNAIIAGLLTDIQGYFIDPLKISSHGFVILTKYVGTTCSVPLNISVSTVSNKQIIRK